MLTRTPIDSYTQLYAVIGHPIRHSKSPIMMNKAFAEMKWNAVYVAFDIEPNQLAHAVQAMKTMPIQGMNVTIPHKVDIMAYLDEIDEHARYIGAVNVVALREGRLFGYNTDGIGYTRSLQEETGYHLQGKRVLMIGAGGASRGVAYALVQAGIAKLTIANRTLEKANTLLQSFQSQIETEAIEIHQVASRLPEIDVMINTTSVGMSPHIDEMPIDIQGINEQHLVSDLIYNPIETKLLQEARKRGARVHGGLGMFIYQGAYAFEYWTGLQAPIEVMRQVVERSFHRS